MVVLAGSALYTWVKQKEMVAANNSKQQTTNQDAEDQKRLIINEDES